MGYLNIASREIKFSGSGAKLQWGLAVGVVVDKIIGVRDEITEENLLSNIRSELASRELAEVVKDPSKMSAEEKRVVDGLLRGAGTKLTTVDLHRVFEERRG
jgi:hypothetical protein